MLLFPMTPLIAVVIIVAATAIVLTILHLEKTYPIDPNLPKSAVVLDYKLVIINFFLTVSCGVLVSTLSGKIVELFGGGLIRLRVDTWYWFLSSLLIYILCGDLYRYWAHRLFHIVPALWEIHSFHHSADALTFMTGARHHWTSYLVNAFFPLFPILFQAPPEIIYIGTFIYFLPDGCAHLNFRFHLGRFVMWFNSPQYHRIHHSTKPEHLNKNFAALLPLWDIIFGTAWHPGKDDFPVETGLIGGEKPVSVWEGIVWPFRNLLPIRQRRGTPDAQQI